ncbi:gamma-glutamyltranspeptidase [Renibacterium salmoninarum ATCC 33209]|uniref:Gamma-glutamyltranspeptidase n=1 Tax=Renibacterium salmoninarum (strain ATCC 33209 / DSM 20767 / JCM 11484 / NBRC 15589 / NCIMB 2235) TaxID=288705 RepID=A9WL75_RENSM|nr:gamma-glutamyltransferase [Renibacterium salmoninarum]ABY21789.1 gamma-glutamyltranspeptidase [Renibacterium salmoninarum ATCC 33209]
MKNPELAQTYRTIADKGLAGFYQGEIAQDYSQRRKRASFG